MPATKERLKRPPSLVIEEIASQRAYLDSLLRELYQSKLREIGLAIGDIVRFTTDGEESANRYVVDSIEFATLPSMTAEVSGRAIVAGVTMATQVYLGAAWEKVR